MKITSQSADELVLKEGSTSGIIVGVALAIGGVLVGYFLRQTSAMAIWIALAVVVAGIAVVCFSSAITVVANKTTGKLAYEKKRLIGGSSTTYAIADILRIETRKQWRVDNTPPSGNQQVSTPTPTLVAPG